MEELPGFQPSRRGLANLRPTLMFDLQRLVDNIPGYDAKTNPSGLIDIASSLNVLMQPEALKYSKRYMLSSAENSLQYGSTAGSPKLLNAVASYVNTCFDPSEKILPSQIMATNGVSALISILAFNLCDTGEGIMYPVPEYGMFGHDIAAQNGLEVIEVKMTGIEDRFCADSAESVIQKFRLAVQEASQKNIKVRALMVSNPCNPLGRSYSRRTLISLARFCAEENMHFVSDEIYAMSSISTCDPGLDGFTSVLSLRSGEGVALDNLHCLYGASKDFGFGGLRLGFLITRNEILQATVRKLGAFSWVNAFADNFFAAFLSDKARVAKFLNIYHRRLQAAHMQATKFLTAKNITYDAANSGIFLWIDLSPWLKSFSSCEGHDSPELQLAFYLIRRGVYLEPGEAFSSPEPGKFRLVYSAAKSDVLGIALHRLSEALNDLNRQGFRRSDDKAEDDSSIVKGSLRIEARNPRGILSRIISCFVR